MVEPIAGTVVGELISVAAIVGLLFGSGVGPNTGMFIGVGVVGLRLGLGVFEGLAITASIVGVCLTLVCPPAMDTTIITPTTSSASPNPPPTSHTQAGTARSGLYTVPSMPGCSTCPTPVVG